MPRSATAQPPNAITLDRIVRMTAVAPVRYTSTSSSGLFVSPAVDTDRRRTHSSLSPISNAGAQTRHVCL